MPAPAPFPPPFPALYLYPLNDSFVPKHISLAHSQRVKIGRQTNAKTTPGERNGYFDSKVLSRQHAEVWEEGGKIFIRDVKSSNGTFINGERLSSEGLESEPFELKSDDIVEFGIDIVGEDNKTIVHHKVAARVVCIFSEQDAQMAARAEQHQMQQMQQYSPGSSSMNASNSGTLMNQPGPSSAGPGSASSFNFSGQQPPRRPQLAQQGIAGMGGMGGSMRPPGKSGLTFDHIINRLQGELQKSRETGAELHTVATTMNEIHDTLAGGNLPANAPPHPHNLPPVRQPSQQQQQQPQAQPSDAPPVSSPPQPEPSNNDSSTTSDDASSPSSALLLELQNQLKETQASLSLHVEKIRALEGALKEQDAMRHEVDSLHEMMKAVQHREISQRSIDGPSPEKPRRSSRDGFDVFDEREEDFDDNESVATVMAHELERVEEEDEDEVAEDMEPPRNRVDELDMELLGEENISNDEVDAEQEDQDREADQEARRQRQEELGRPRTPEPTGLGMNNRESRTRSKTLTGRHPSSLQQSHVPPSHAVIDEFNTRLASLTAQLESALELSSNLQAQHSTAQGTIASLESKVESLEALVKATLVAQQQQAPVVEAPPSPPPVEEEKPSAEELARESLTSMVMEWKKSVEGQWSNVQEEWNQERERLNRAREEWESKTRMVDAGLERMERIQKIVSSRDDAYLNGNGDASSRHSISGGLVTPPSPRSLSSDSNRPRRRRSSSGRGRTGLRKRSLSRGAETDDTEATLANDEPHSFDKTKLVKRALHLTGIHEDDAIGVRSLVTPEPSLKSLSMSGVSFDPSELRRNSDPLPPIKHDYSPNRVNIQTAMGVLVLSVAAAAVVWRVKPET
ncbi:hypothetical protein D9758_011785 [Tetrapyrgos nigripes]|uniref:FHA domain-containing protein n=1 Tax=Tetrapyrgos nigripes TaxID=182062 RepID=A0A8H5CYF3_9AGAR|nr:hypothetical protein D9758_011785 [Tetrapyrgos nigripes]